MRSAEKTDSSCNGWRGIGLVATIYIYFLIYAQFGFLKQLASLGIGGDQLKMVMGAMATGGILTSLFVSRCEGRWQPAWRLRVAFVGCAFGAGLALVPLSLVGAILIAFLIGISLGLLTVTLVTHLKLWLGTRQPLLKIGLGVGVAYLVCNYPPLFTTTPAVMALFAMGLCGLGILLPAQTDSSLEIEEPSGGSVKTSVFVFALACFTALVWVDSAAFYIIQNTPALKGGTWEGARRLWQNGSVHLLAALGSAFLLKRRGLSLTLVIAFLFLGGACLLLAEPSRVALASIFYPAGVSFYSVALVAYPSFLDRSVSVTQRARRTGWLYAVAGWIGSGLGIGMGENLKHIPPAFVLSAALLFFAGSFWKLLRGRLREMTVVVLMFSGAWLIQIELSRDHQRVSLSPELSPIERGRQVYIAEGCINCHSQYVRPNTLDEWIWGAPSNVEQARNQQPPLIGNRRQGPDLAEVGNRRSPLWLKAHCMNPEGVSHGSFMPVYARLFNDGRGDDLIAYITSLGQTNLMMRLAKQENWRLSPGAWSVANHVNGAELFQTYCATCHSAAGSTRSTWQTQFKRLPPDLENGPFNYVPTAATPEWRRNQIAKIIKFGLPGTDMPGHEYLADEQVAVLAQYVVNHPPLKP